MCKTYGISDKAFWYSLDRHLPEREFENKVSLKQGYVLLKDEKPIGLLRYNLFWDNTPFGTMLYVASDYQGQGFGKALMRHWEEEMRQFGYGMVMTSTQVDENAQHFYKNGDIKTVAVGSRNDDSEGSYENFIQNVDTVIMGRTTYEQVTSVLSPDTWPYDGIAELIYERR